MARATDTERKEKLIAKRKQLEAQIAEIKNRRRSKERRFLTRQKIIVGGAILAEAKSNPQFAAMLAALLGRAVVRDVDKVVVKEFMENRADP